MRFKLATLLAAATGVAVTQVASAADIPAPVYKAPPAAIVSQTWNGCYVGANGGYGWQRRQDAIGDNGSSFLDLGTLRPSGGFGGGQVGCNYQTGFAVLGLEADFQGSGIRDSFGPTLLPAGVLTASGRESLRWFGTVRGRLGWAVDRVLLYVTGGLAYGKTDYSVSGFDAAANHFEATSNATKAGYVIGGGAEWAFLGAWSLKTEYQYINLGTIGPLTATVFNAAGVPNGVTVTTTSIRNDYHTVRLGLNYRFGASPVWLRP